MEAVGEGLEVEREVLEGVVRHEVEEEEGLEAMGEGQEAMEEGLEAMELVIMEAVGEGLKEVG